MPSSLGGIEGKGAGWAIAMGSEASGNLFSKTHKPGVCSGLWLVTMGGSEDVLMGRCSVMGTETGQAL